MAREGAKVEAAKAWCADFVAARPSNVTRLAARLAPWRRALFFPAYCAMRAIDDEVDEGFLRLDAVRRRACRRAMAARLNAWRRHASAAACGRYRGGGAGDHHTIFTAMNATIGQSVLGPEPFAALARAMGRDVEERQLAGWGDFLDYAEGAAVAPAAVFVFILACQAQTGALRLARPCADYVRHLALFSYLVHILRDLRGDAWRAPQHLTLPAAALRAAGLTRPQLQRAARAGDRDALAPLVAAVVPRARRHRAHSVDDLARLVEDTAGRGALLARLAEVYDRQLDAIEADYGAVLAGDGVLPLAAVDRLLAAD